MNSVVNDYLSDSYLNKLNQLDTIRKYNEIKNAEANQNILLILLSRV